MSIGYATMDYLMDKVREELMGKSWFKHDVNARHDPKIILMRASYEASGYGLYWMLIETLRESDGYKFPKKHLSALGLDYGYPTIEQFVRDCIDTFDLLSEDEEYIWSESLLTRMKNYEKLCEERAEYGKRGGIARAKQELSKSQGFAIAKCSEEIRLDKIRVDKKRIKEQDIHSGAIDEVLTYFKEKTGSGLSLKTEALRSKVRGRLTEGYTVDDCKRAIAFVYGSKIDNPDQRQYIRIDTIFAPTKFAGYVDAQRRETR